MKVSVKPINSVLLWIFNFLGSLLFHQHFATWFLNIILPSVQRLCCFPPPRGCWEMKECGSWGPAGLGLRHNLGVTLAPNAQHLISSTGLDELKPFPGIIWEPCRWEKVTCVPEKEPTRDEESSPVPSSLSSAVAHCRLSHTSTPIVKWTFQAPGFAS